MKLGQMASYVDDGPVPGRPPDAVPAAGQRPADERRSWPRGWSRRSWASRRSEVFAEWDPEPIAAASIGQVHRAITHDGRAVAVKVQYPGIAETMAADLDNVALLRRMLQDHRAEPGRRRARRRAARAGARGARLPPGGGQPAAVRRLLRRATPRSTCRAIIDELSTRRVVTSELSDGARFAELATLVAGGARPGRGDDLPVRVPQPVRGCTRSTATRTRATTCSTAAAGSRSWTSGWSSTSPTTSCGRSCTWSATCAWTTTPRRSGAAWRRRASCARTRR